MTHAGPDGRDNFMERKVFKFFSCPSSSRPTLVTYSLTNVYVVVLDSKPSRPNPQPRKSDGGHEKIWPNQQKDNDKDKYKDKENEKYI